MFLSINEYLNKSTTELAIILKCSQRNIQIHKKNNTLAKFIEKKTKLFRETFNPNLLNEIKHERNERNIDEILAKLEQSISRNTDAIVRLEKALNSVVLSVNIQNQSETFNEKSERNSEVKGEFSAKKGVGVLESDSIVLDSKCLDSIDSITNESKEKTNKKEKDEIVEEKTIRLRKVRKAKERRVLHDVEPYTKEDEVYKVFKGNSHHEVLTADDIQLKDFFDSYPKRKGCANASFNLVKRAWKKLSLADKQALANSYPTYLQQCAKLTQEGKSQYIAMATTFLNQRRWEGVNDEPENSIEAENRKKWYLYEQQQYDRHQQRKQGNLENEWI